MKVTSGFRKSSKSGNGGNCVEVATAEDAA
jgi:hypothetical protein